MIPGSFQEIDQAAVVGQEPDLRGDDTDEVGMRIEEMAEDRRPAAAAAAGEHGSDVAHASPSRR
jgi:hypothetical protein